MLPIPANGNVTFFGQPLSPRVPQPPQHRPDEPAASTAPAVNPRPDRSQPFNPPSLRQLRLQEQAGRPKRDTAAQGADVPATGQKERRRYPARADAEKADTKLQKNLVQWLKTGKPNENVIPEKSSVAPFIAMYNQALNEPSVQAWFSAQGLIPATIRVFSDCVVGTVMREGKAVIQRFSTTDGSGWGQVSHTINALQKVLSPSDLGLPGTPDFVSIGRDVLLDFYGVKPPLNEKAAPKLARHLRQEGWPTIAQTARDGWEGQFNALLQHRHDSAVRTRLVEQFQSQFTTEPNENVIELDNQAVAVEPGSSLDRRSHKARQLFLEFLASATFQAFVKKAGFDLPGSEFRMSEFRLSEGELQMRNLAGEWVSLQNAFDDEVERASRVDDLQGHAARKMNADFDQLVKMSEKTGNALYNTRTYDARQTLAFYTPDTPKTVGQLRATLGWLGNQLPPPPLAGDYASMTPYGEDQGGLSEQALEALKGQSAQVMTAFKDFSRAPLGFQSYPDPDRQLAEFFDSPQAVALAEQIAKSLKLFAVADGQALPRAERHQLLATALKLNVDAPVPGLPGHVAGYSLYQPDNMGRTLKEVRQSVERHLESKGVDAKVSALMAHLFMAQSAPEMLVKRDPALAADAAQAFNQDPENIKVGSTGWMNLRLGCAIAGDSRVNFTQALALANQDITGPEQEALLKELGVQSLLDWGVMSGIFPASSDGKYSPGDYEAAATAFTTRENQTREAFDALMSEPPTQASLLVEQLAILFPEMTKEEIRNITLDGYPPTSIAAAAFEKRSYNLKSKMLIDVILMNQSENKPALGTLDKWTDGAFIHPKVSLAEFRERIKQLPRIEPLVAPAVDKYITTTRAAQATALKLMFTQLTLEQRMALERSPQIECFTLRAPTGDDLKQDNGPESNVAKNEGRHGVLIRYETGQAKPKYGYWGIYPNSMTMGEIKGLPDDLKLGGEIRDGTKPHVKIPGVNITINTVPTQFHRGTVLPIDFEAFHKGVAPRPGVSSEVIVEKLGEPLKRPAAHTHHRIPNTFTSSITSQLVDRLLEHSFDDSRAGRIAFANEPSDLHKRTYPFKPGKYFTAENARMLLNLIPFVGSIADLVEGKTLAGVKGLLIDIGSFLITGGLAGAKTFAKGLTMLVPFSSKPFTLAGLKGGASFIRGLFNPLENIPDLMRTLPRGLKGAGKVANNVRVRLGSNIYVPPKIFEQWRWTAGAWDTSFSGGARTINQFPGARKGFSGTKEVVAVQKHGSWYAINPASHRPDRTPLEHFKPQPAA